MVARTRAKAKTNSTARVKKDLATKSSATTIVAEAFAWIDRYGCRPAVAHPLGSRLRVVDLPGPVNARLAELNTMKRFEPSLLAALCERQIKVRLGLDNVLPLLRISAHDGSLGHFVQEACKHFFLASALN